MNEFYTPKSVIIYLFLEVHFKIRKRHAISLNPHNYGQDK